MNFHFYRHEQFAGLFTDRRYSRSLQWGCTIVAHQGKWTKINSKPSSFGCLPSIFASVPVQIKRLVHGLFWSVGYRIASIDHWLGIWKGEIAFVVTLWKRSLLTTFDFESGWHQRHRNRRKFIQTIAEPNGDICDASRLSRSWCEWFGHMHTKWRCQGIRTVEDQSTVHQTVGSQRIECTHDLETKSYAWAGTIPIECENQQRTFGVRETNVWMILFWLMVVLIIFRNEDLRILASDEFGIIPASTRLQVALATVASIEQNVWSLNLDSGRFQYSI